MYGQHKLPILKINIAGDVYEIGPDQYIRRDIEGTCTLNINKLDLPPNEDSFILLGNPFFSKYDFAHAYGDDRNESGCYSVFANDSTTSLPRTAIYFEIAVSMARGQCKPTALLM